MRDVLILTGIGLAVAAVALAVLLALANPDERPPGPWRRA